MNRLNPVEFVAALEVAAADPATDKLLPSNSGCENAEGGVEESYVNNKSLCSFVANVSAQNRKDVLNSTLLAQKAADKKFPEPQQIDQWYETYLGVLTNIGWVIENKDFVEFSSATDVFEVDKALLNILGALVGNDYLSLLTKVLDDLKNLSDEDGRIKIFEKNANNLSKGNFQIGLANEENDAVSMHLGAFKLESKDQINKILFFKSTTDRLSLRYSVLKCTLNNDIYALVRNDILTKISETAKSVIAKIEI